MLNLHQVREIVRTHLPGNRLKSFNSIPSPDSRTCILNLRHPPFKVILKSVEVDGMRKFEVERALGRILNEDERIRVPEVICLDESRGIVPFPFYLRNHIPGLPWNDIMTLLPESDRLTLARRCGEALGVFHGVETDVFGEIDDKNSSPPWSPLVLDRAMKQLDEAIEKERIDPGEGNSIGDRLSESRDLLEFDGRPQLTHRRLTPADLLVKNEGGDWIVTGLLGIGGSAIWDHLWDMASLTRQLGKEHPDILDELQDSHYEIVSRPRDYEERLEVMMILENLDFLSRCG